MLAVYFANHVPGPERSFSLTTSSDQFRMESGRASDRACRPLKAITRGSNYARHFESHLTGLARITRRALVNNVVSAGIIPPRILSQTWR